MQHIPVRIQSKDDNKKGPLFPELVGKKTFKAGDIHVGILEGGMVSGETSVMFLVETAEALVCVEMSADMLNTINGVSQGAVERFRK